MRNRMYLKNMKFYDYPLKYNLDYLTGRGVKVSFGQITKNYTSFKIGGPADVVITPRNNLELKHTLDFLSEIVNLGINYHIIGGASNLLIADEGIRGLVIRLCYISPIIYDGEYIWVSGAEPVSRIISYCSDQGFGGLEYLSGIPGTVGGSIIMNAGTNNEAIGHSVGHVHTWYSGEKEYINKDLDFSYRHSILQKTNEIVTRVALKVKREDSLRIIKRVREFLLKRRKGQPLTLPSAGSVFKNPPNYSAGQLLEEVGVKGLRVGGAQVSYTHSNFIINIDDASSYDVLKLIKLMQTAVQEKTDIVLEPEIIYIGG
ncbi:MAG: UDP-N-acetylenolpyruvoylglucosamine reductase [candidate division WS2 bacterium]|nr:UDP-N-acetylenolpyruvoylglucosamine reductase [Candidatus Lithacetigena glycinireducens]